MARPRSSKHRHLPPGLYAHHNGWRYTDPGTGERHFYPDLKLAMAVALKVNAERAVQAQASAEAEADRLLKGSTGKLISDAIAKFREEDVPARSWSPRTAYDQGTMMDRIEKARGTRLVATFSKFDCATMLDELAGKSATVRLKFKKLLTGIFARAVSSGWAEENVALELIAHQPKRQRSRLTMEQFVAIRDHEQTPKFLRDAMDIGLHTLLRRGDLSALRFSDIRDGTIHVEPSKTKDSTGVRIAFAIGPELEPIIRRCRDNIASPFLIHRLPDRISKRDLCSGREHHTQVLGPRLADAFQTVRDLLYPKMKHPPTFHEIRSLGIAHYLDMGYTEEEVQAIAGHGSVAMTRGYRKDHARPWQQVKAGFTRAAQGG